MKQRDMVHGCMVYTERAEMAAVSHGTSHVTTEKCCKYTTLVDIQNVHLVSCDESAASLLESGE